jgi:isopentenyl phosphate kinase
VITDNNTRGVTSVSQQDIKSCIAKLRHVAEVSYDEDLDGIVTRRTNNAARRVNRAALRIARTEWLEERDYT